MSFRLRIAVLISLLAHAFLSLLSLLIEAPPAVAPVDAVEISFIENPKEQGQIVDQPEQAVNDEVDSAAKFLSKNNQKVQKQTVAQNRGEFQNGGGNGMHRFLPQFQAQQALEKLHEQEREKEALLVQNMQNKPTGSSGLMSQTLDYIKDLDPSLETMLSTREFIYYTYYRRIRQQLNQYWNPEIQETVKKIYATGRQLASDSDKITRCLVTLDRNGKLLKVQIIGQSGVRDLDEAAVRAFRYAAPFPNPPSGMVESDGTIQIRWDFILEA